MSLQFFTSAVLVVSILFQSLTPVWAGNNGYLNPADHARLQEQVRQQQEESQYEDWVSEYGTFILDQSMKVKDPAAIRRSYIRYFKDTLLNGDDSRANPHRTRAFMRWLGTQLYKVNKNVNGPNQSLNQFAEAIPSQGQYPNRTASPTVSVSEDGGAVEAAARAHRVLILANVIAVGAHNEVAGAIARRSSMRAGFTSSLLFAFTVYLAFHGANQIGPYFMDMYHHAISADEFLRHYLSRWWFPEASEAVYYYAAFVKGLAMLQNRAFFIGTGGSVASYAVYMYWYLRIQLPRVEAKAQSETGGEVEESRWRAFNEGYAAAALEDGVPQELVDSVTQPISNKNLDEARAKACEIGLLPLRDQPTGVRVVLHDALGSPVVGPTAETAEQDATMSRGPGPAQREGH